MKKESFFKPSSIKIVFTFIFLIPSFVLTLLFSFNPLVSLIIGVIIGYILACGFDNIYQKTKNKWVKVILIVVATIISLGAAFFIFLWIFSITVCDPVHRPTECEIACEQIYKNVTNITETARQKYVECIQKCFEG